MIRGLKGGEPGAKFDAGRFVELDLSGMPRAILAVAEVGTYGTEKYSEGGWKVCR